MATVTVIGGTGYAGSAIAAEAARRGHQVRSVSRTAPAEPLEGIDYITGSALDADVRAAALEGADAVVIATAARGDMVDYQGELTAALAADAAASGTRLIAVGGFSVLRPAAGAARFIEVGVPEPYRVEAGAGYALLQLLQESPESLDYVYVSPAGAFGSYAPAEPAGAYRLGDEIAILDERAKAPLAAADYALAVVDLIDSGEHRREHVSVVNA